MGWGTVAKLAIPIITDLIVDKFIKKEDGGAIKKTQPAMIHAGEYILPKGVKPTPAQRRAVAKKKLTKQKAQVKQVRPKVVKAKAPKKAQVRKPQIRKPVNQLVKKKRKGKK